METDCQGNNVIHYVVIQFIVFTVNVQKKKSDSQST